MELWNKVAGYNNCYLVSNLGNVKSITRTDCRGRFRRGRILKPNRLKDGYEQVGLYVNGKCKYVKVHRLVAEAFVDNPDAKPEVNHKNGIRHDNRADNLEWVTKSENLRHSFRVLGRVHSKPSLGKRSSRRKLTTEQVSHILLDNRSQSQIAMDYGVVQQTISNIKNGVFYRF